MVKSAAKKCGTCQLSPSMRIHAAFQYALSGVCGKQKSMYGVLPAAISCAASR